MTQPAVAKRTSFIDTDPVTWAVIAVLIVAACVAMSVAGRVYGPVDTLATQQACSAHGDSLDRPLVDYERSRRFAIVGRTDGYCLFGPVTTDGDTVGAAPIDEAAPVDEADPGAAAEPLQVSLSGFDPGSPYKAGKWMGVILQLGAASVAVRLLADPLLDRFVRHR